MPLSMRENLMISNILTQSPLEDRDLNQILELLRQFTVGSQEVQHRTAPQSAPDNDVMLLVQRQVELLTTIANLLAPLSAVADQIARAAQESEVAAATPAPAPAKRTRKPKEGNGAAASTQAATVSPVPPATEAVQPAPVTAPASDGTDGMPDFLKRAGTPEPAQTAPAPAPGKYTRTEVEAVLTEYMDHFAENGFEKLAALLDHFGATTLSTLKPEHYDNCVATARKELLS